MPTLDRNVTIHNLPIEKVFHLKSNLDIIFTPSWYQKIKKEIHKLIDVRFIHGVDYPTWDAKLREKEQRLASHLFGFSEPYLPMLERWLSTSSNWTHNWWHH